MPLSNARNDHVNAARPQRLSIEIDWDQSGRRHTTCHGHESRVDNPRAKMALQALNMGCGVVSNRLVWFLQEVGDVDSPRR